MIEERRTPEADASAGRELDAEIEQLTGRIVELVNTATPGQRETLREYAVGLLKEGTEIGELPEAHAEQTHGAGSNPLGIALLLGVAALPALVLFAPIGLTLLAVAAVMAVFGVVGTWLRR